MHSFVLSDFCRKGGECTAADIGVFFVLVIIRSRHAQQIKLIDEPVLPVRDLDTLYQEIMQAISPILALLSEKRASAIRQYLKYRLHYLKAAMG